MSRNARMVPNGFGFSAGGLRGRWVMAWCQLDKPKVLKLTKSMAESFRDLKPPHDRPLSAKRLATYRKLLEDKELRSVSWAKCYCSETDCEYRVNGQHTATMFAEMEVIPEFYIQLESYIADTLEDVARLWSTFDSRLQVRSTSDINGGFAASVEDLADMPSKFVNLLVTGLAYFAYGEGYYNIPAATRASALLSNVEFAMWSKSLFYADGIKKPMHLYRGPVVGAMYGTWQKCKKDATEFWQQVRDDTGESPSMPDRKLSRWLASMTVNIGRGSKGVNTRMARQREFFVRSIHAWNAWRKNTTTDLKYYPSAKVPTIL